MQNMCDYGLWSTVREYYRIGHTWNELCQLYKNSAAKDKPTIWKVTIICPIYVLEKLLNKWKILWSKKMLPSSPGHGAASERANPKVRRLKK